MGEPELEQKDLVLTHQAGVGKQTCSVVFLLAAAGALLRRLAVVLELCPARPVGAITCHPSFTRAWLLHSSSHRGGGEARNGASSQQQDADLKKKPTGLIYLPTLLHQLPPSFTSALTPATPPDTHPSFIFPAFAPPSELSGGGCQAAQSQ